MSRLKRKAQIKLIIRRARNRILWRLVKDRAVYHPYRAGSGSGWAGRYVWRERVIAYQTDKGKVWN